MVSIQCDNNIPCSAQESAFVCSAIAAMQFRDNQRTHLPGDSCRAISGTVVHNNNFIDKGRYFAQYLANAGLLIETRYDGSDAAVLVHTSNARAIVCVH